MGSFFKSFGKGILYVIFLPFIILILALYALLGLFVMCVLFIKNIVLFFKGKSIFTPLTEDLEAAAILHTSKDIQQKILSQQIEAKQNVSNTTNNIYILSNDGSLNKINKEDIINNAPIYEAKNDNVLALENKNEAQNNEEEKISLTRNENANNNKVSEIISKKEEKLFIDKYAEEEVFLAEPEPEEKEKDLFKNEQNKKMTNINLEENNEYKPKQTIINKEDYISDEEIEEQNQGFSFKDLNRK